MQSSGFDAAQLVWQIGQRRVISLWRGEGGETARIVQDVYDLLKVHGCAKTTFQGVRFDEFEWVNVPSPFSLKGCCQQMPGYDDDQNPESYFYEFWKRQVMYNEYYCSYLLVIEGLQSKEDWNELRDAGLVPDAASNSCVVIITDKEAVAKDCDDDDSSRKKANDNDAAITIGRPLFAQKVCSVHIAVLLIWQSSVPILPPVW
jgi:hypothetical protein